VNHTHNDTPRAIWRNPNRREHAGNPPTFQVIQQADGRLNTRRLRAASPLQTAARSPRKRVLSKRACALLLVLALVVLAYLAGAASAHAGEIGEPWCQVSAPTLPASSPAQAQLNCIKPRAFIPLVTGGRHESGDQSDRNHLRAADSVSVGNHDGSAVAVIVFCLLAGAGFSPPRVEMGWTLGGCVDETARPVGQATDVETGSNSAPTARVAGVEDGSGSLLR
jgi:hypothetical protein